MTKLLITIMCLSCCIYYTGFHQTFTLAKAYTWEILGSLCLIPLVLTTRFKSFSRWILLYLLFGGLATLLSRDVYLAFWGYWGRGIGFDDTLLYILAVLILQSRCTEEDRAYAENMLCVVGLSYALVSFLQVSGYFVGPHTFPAHSLAGNSNMAGFVYVLVLPFMLKRWKWLTPILLTGLALSMCRGAIVTSGAILFFWFIRNKWCRVTGLILVMGTILVIRQLPDTNRFTNMWHYENTPRFIVIRESLPLISFLGLGHTAYREEYGKIKSKAFEERTPGILFDSPHNVFLTHIITYGVIPTIVWMWLILGVLRNRRRHYRFAMFGFCLVGMVSFETVETLPLFWLLIGISDD